MTKAILGGFLGTVLMTTLMYVVAPVTIGHSADIARMLSPLAAGSWIGGMVIHFVNGTLVFPLIYAGFVYRFLPGSPPVKGLYWALVLWLVAQTLVFPALGGGFFSGEVGGTAAVLGSLITHLVYGATLGSIADGPYVAPGRRTPVPPPVE